MVLELETLKSEDRAFAGGCAVFVVNSRKKIAPFRGVNCVARGYAVLALWSIFFPGVIFM